MENRKDIGKAISDKLSSLEKTPRENVWNGISYELEKKKKRRLAFFFFWTKTIGLLLIGVLTALYVYNQNGGFNAVSPKNNPNESTIVDGNDGKNNSNSSINGNNQTNDSVAENNNAVAESENNFGNKSNSAGNKNTMESINSVKNQDAVNTKNNRKSVSTNKKSGNSIVNNPISFKGKSKQFSKVKSKKQIKKNQSKSKKTTKTLSKSDSIANQNTTALDLTSLQNGNSSEKPKKEVNAKKTDSLIAKKEKEKTKNINMYPEDKKEQDSAKSYRKFEVDAFVSPTYYGHFSNNSTLDSRLDSISKSSEIKLSYGVGLTYELTEKFSIRIGYSKIDLELTTKNALVNTSNYYGIKYKPGVTNQTIYTASNNAEKMDITQKMSYTEIPLELKYKFMNKKIGMNAIFGFSYLMLNENTISIKTNNGYNQQIGKSNNVLDTSISTNIGVGFDYEIFKNTKIFAEPMFNYQMMSFDNSNPKPYFFGIHTGIRYTFLNK